MLFFDKKFFELRKYEYLEGAYYLKNKGRKKTLNENIISLKSTAGKHFLEWILIEP